MFAFACGMWDLVIVACAKTTEATAWTIAPARRSCSRFVFLPDPTTVSVRKRHLSQGFGKSSWPQRRTAGNTGLHASGTSCRQSNKQRTWKIHHAHHRSQITNCTSLTSFIFLTFSDLRGAWSIPQLSSSKLSNGITIKEPKIHTSMFVSPTPQGNVIWKETCQRKVNDAPDYALCVPLSYQKVALNFVWKRLC